MPDGSPGSEAVEKRELKDGTVRVIETILMLNRDAAKALHQFPEVQIGEPEKLGP
jgi:hypothetical protein